MPSSNHFYSLSILLPLNATISACLFFYFFQNLIAINCQHFKTLSVILQFCVLIVLMFRLNWDASLYLSFRCLWLFNFNVFYLCASSRAHLLYRLPFVLFFHFRTLGFCSHFVSFCCPFSSFGILFIFLASIAQSRSILSNFILNL